MAKKAKVVRRDLISRDEDFVHRGGIRSGWDKDTRSSTDYVLRDFARPRTAEEEMREINRLCLNRCTIIADGKRVAFNINPAEETARTDGQRIVVGTTVLGDPKKSFNEMADIMVGLTTHEMAHVRYTKFKKHTNSMLHSIVNVIEDERIEHLLTEEFPGYAHNLAAVKSFMLDERYLIDKAIAEGQTNIGKELSAKEKKAMEIYDIFFKLVRYPVHIDEDVYNKNIKEIEQIQEILTPYPMTSEEVEETAEKVYKLLRKIMKDKVKPKPKPKPAPQPKSKKKEEEEEEEQDEPGDPSGEPGEESGEGGKGEGDSGTNSDEESEEKDEEAQEDENEEEESEDEGNDQKEEEEEEDDDEEESESKSPENSDESEEEEEEQEGEGDGDEGEEEEDEDEEEEEESEESKDSEEESKKDSEEEEKRKMMEDLREKKADKAAEQIIKALEAEIGRMMEGFESDNDPEKEVEHAPEASQFPISEEFIFDPESKARFRIGSPDKARYEKLADGVSNDARRLASSLFTRVFNESKNLRGLRSGQLDDAKIIEAAHGVSTVHTQKIEKESRSLNIAVLIDESGSMGCQGGEKVDNAAKAGILIEKAFETFRVGQLFIYGFTSDMGEHNTIYRYREPGLKVSHGLGNVQGRGNNRDGECIRAVVRRVRTFTRDPILFFIVSDGQPNARDYGGYADTRHAVTYATKQRFFPIQIGIGSGIKPENQAQMFDEFIHYDTAKQMVDDLRKLILRKAHKIFGL
jgi:hypothetical protein